MKIILHLFILSINVIVFSQPAHELTKNSFIVLCHSKVVYNDYIVDNNLIQCSFIIYKDNEKPIMASHKNGDTLFVDDCRFCININNNGKVRFVNVIPDSMHTNPDSYIIRKMKVPPKMNMTAEEMERIPEKIWLLGLFYQSTKITSRVIGVNKYGITEYYEYEPIRSFDSEEEARKFAAEKNITDIEIN